MPVVFPLIAVDIALFTLMEGQLRVLFLERANQPFQGAWALPGGVLKPDEDDSLDNAAIRILATKVNVHVRHVEQVVTVSGKLRDPRGWSLSTLYFALLPPEEVQAIAGSKAASIFWADPAAQQRRLGFDHALLLDYALSTLREKVGGKSLPLHLLAPQFTLTEVQQACEAILGCKLDKGTFRRRIGNDAFLVELPGVFRTGPQRPAQLYSRSVTFRF